MIQNIGEKTLINHYAPNRAYADSLIMIFFKRDLLLSSEDQPKIPTRDEYFEMPLSSSRHLVFAFSIDDKDYFLSLPNIPAGEHDEPPEAPDGYEFVNMFAVTHGTGASNEMRLAVSTGVQLNRWYINNYYCGRCGCPVVHSESERMLECPHCGNRIFPKISPAIIAAVTDGDKLLMTRYKGRAYKERALVAGFCEIGETAEQTVAREVYEETGIRVKNIKYVGSQPWGIDDDLLLGFKAELDGLPSIRTQESELSSAEWVPRGEIFEKDDDVSLTRYMITLFKNGEL
ncbi:MAG: NAD(+) diphosphatase [Coriobacteriales bacterium]|jgi:NAD+ diphosphatase